MQYIKHYKGGIYKLIGDAKHTETGEHLVIYQNANGEIFARPFDMFHESVLNSKGERVSRFVATNETFAQPSQESHEHIKFNTDMRVKFGMYMNYYRWDLALAWFRMSNEDFHKTYGFNFVPRGKLFDEVREYVHWNSKTNKVEETVTKPNVSIDDILNNVSKKVEQNGTQSLFNDYK